MLIYSTNKPGRAESVLNSNPRTLQNVFLRSEKEKKVPLSLIPPLFQAPHHSLRLTALRDEYFTVQVSSKWHLNDYLWIQDTCRCLQCERVEAKSINSQ